MSEQIFAEVTLEMAKTFLKDWLGVNFRNGYWFFSIEENRKHPNQFIVHFTPSFKRRKNNERDKTFDFIPFKKTFKLIPKGGQDVNAGINDLLWQAFLVDYFAPLSPYHRDIGTPLYLAKWKLYNPIDFNPCSPLFQPQPELSIVEGIKLTQNGQRVWLTGYVFGKDMPKTHWFQSSRLIITEVGNGYVKDWEGKTYLLGTTSYI